MILLYIPFVATWTPMLTLACLNK